MAIQLIINKELGLAKNENPLQGAFIIDDLTDLDPADRTADEQRRPDRWRADADTQVERHDDTEMYRVHAESGDDR